MCICHKYQQATVYMCVCVEGRGQHEGFVIIFNGVSLVLEFYVSEDDFEPVILQHLTPQITVTDHHA